MKDRVWNHPGVLSVSLAGMCLLLNACAGIVKPNSGGGGGGGTPAASVSPGSLTFASQTVNTTSAAQTVTLTNSGSAALNITSIAITGTNSGDFSQTNTCGSSVNASATCTISVTFKPTAAGSRSANVSITDDASGSPHTASLTGTGASANSPAVTLSPTSLTFASQTVNTTSAAQSITLTNSGTAALSLTSITLTGTNSGDFAQTNTCGSTVNASATCTISVTFTPTATGSRTANVSITDNATGSPQTASLTGTGASAGGNPAVTLSPTSLTFASQTVNTTSAAQSITLTNSGTATLSVTSIAITGTNSGDFSQTNTCGSSVNASATCTISVTFTPTATGSRTANVSITDNATGSPQTASLTGTGAGVVTGPAGAPAIFFTDLLSGPNTGGENGNGTILTIYGARFGSVQGGSTVTVGGGLVASYKLWSDSKISVALGAAAQTGNVVVTTGNGSSNGKPFTVRAGNIFCVSTAGNDGNTGAFPSTCWNTILHAKATISAGDIAYVMDGVVQSAADALGASLSIKSNDGTPSAPKALVAYPGAVATIGGGGQAWGIRAISASHWVIAGFSLRGPSSTLAGLNSPFIVQGDDTLLSLDWRVVGNDIACPVDNCTGAGSDHITGMAFYGNHVHDVGTPTTSKLMHQVYFSSNSNSMDVAWNEVGGNDQACRGIQFHSSLGTNQFDLHVHDNYIHDIRCDGINFATVDPSKGVVEAYNNLLVHVGSGPDFPEGPANYAGIAVLNATNNGSPCATNCTVKIYNNTVYDAGSQQTSPNGGIVVKSGPNVVLAQNNIFQQLSSELYISGGGTFTCDTNLFFGAGAAPGSCTNSVSQDPLFVNLTARDLDLLLGSPAVDKALASVCPATDKNGVTRPQGAGCDLGAFESH